MCVLVSLLCQGLFSTQTVHCYATQGIDSKNLVHQLCGCLLSTIRPSLSQDGLDGCGLNNPAQREMGRALLKLAMGLSDSVRLLNSLRYVCAVCLPG